MRSRRGGGAQFEPRPLIALRDLLRAARATRRGESGRLVAVNSCGENRINPDGTARDTTPVLSVVPDFAVVDTAALARGHRIGIMEVRQGAHVIPTQPPLVFGQFTTVTAVDSTIVLASDEGGYVIELVTAAGHPTGRIVVPVPRRPVTDAMRQAEIDRKLKALAAQRGTERMAITMAEARRQIIEAPTADSLPSYAEVTSGQDGEFWVLDYLLWSDTTWTATAFRLDGTIVGRVTGPLSSGEGWRRPVWFGRDRVMVREIDDDGVVRFGVYRMEGR